MSAFQVLPRHLSAIVTAWASLAHYAPLLQVNGRNLCASDALDRQILYDALAQANAASVGARYSTPVEPVPGPVRTVVVSTIQAIKAIDCLVYQSCETTEWDGSDLDRALASIRRVLTTKLPGYDEAEWAIS